MLIVLFVLGVCGYLIDGANRPANPHLVKVNTPGGTVAPMPSKPGAQGSPSGMRSAELAVSTNPHSSACVLEAVTPAEQGRGLMDRTSVAPYAGMAFVFHAPSTSLFYMKDTLIPLSIAWFRSDGRFIDATDMPPCPSLTATCPTYSAAAPYTLAVEVPEGRLSAMGIGPGATVHLAGGACGP